MERGSGTKKEMKKQECPHGAMTINGQPTRFYCGDLCPHFKEPGFSVDKDGVGVVNLEICSGILTTTAEEFEDQRAPLTEVQK